MDKMKRAAVGGGSVPDGTLSYLNFLRFGAILLVILLHCLTGFLSDPAYYGGRSFGIILLFNELGRAGVPLFFMLSGYLMLRDGRTLDFTPFYRRRLTRILLPLAVWNVVYGLYFGMTPQEILAGSINQGCAYHLWFLYQLLGLYLLAPFLKRIVDSCTRKQLWWLLLLIAFPGTLRPLFNLATPFYLYLLSFLVEGYAAYFLLGYLLGTAKPSRWDIPGAVACLLVGVLLGIMGNQWGLRSEARELLFNYGYTLNHFLLAGGSFMLARRCGDLERPWLRRLGAQLAPLAFQVYFVHVLVMEAYEPSAAPIAAILLEWAVTAAVSLAFAAVWREIYRQGKRLWPKQLIMKG